MTASEALSRTLRLQLVDTRDEALRALQEYEEADETTGRVRNELAAATNIFELELDSHTEEKVLEEVAVILNRDEWSAERYADRLEELLGLFDDLGFGRLVNETTELQPQAIEDILKARGQTDALENFRSSHGGRNE